MSKNLLSFSAILEFRRAVYPTTPIVGGSERRLSREVYRGEMHFGGVLFEIHPIRGKNSL